MTNKVSRRAFGAGVLATGLIGQAAPSFAQGEPKRGGTLVATWGGGEPQACYVPAGGGSSPTFSSSKLFERLGNRRMDGVFEGELAEAWKPAADYKSYTIKIRKGVKFHDGKDMTVDDVVYSIDEIWKKYAAASALTDFAGVEAPDADTVVVKFNKPVPEFFFSSLLCGSVNYIVPKHVYAGSDPVTNPANNAPIATGPWKFKEWVRGSHFEYVKNDAYWRKDMPYMDRLIIRYVRDPAGRAAAMEAGDIQIGVFNPVAPPDIKRLTATGKFVATPKGYEESVWSTHAGVQHAQSDLRQARGAAGDVPRRRPQLHRQDRVLRLCAAGHGPDLLAQHGVLHRRHLQDQLRSQEGGFVARRRGISQEARRQALHLEPAGGRLVHRERQDRLLS